MTKPSVLIIGAGFTGCALAYDLSLRGFAVEVFERGEIASGTSGRTHGLLHSGARYCVNDQESAVECIEENITLRRIAKPIIEYNGGFFIALDDSDMEYAPKFVAGAQQCHIEIEELSLKRALELEPYLNPAARAIYTVPDGVFDPLRLALVFAASAKKLGARFHFNHEVTGLKMDGKTAVTGLEVWDRSTGQKKTAGCDLVVSATGAWAGKITQMAGAAASVTPTPGVMVAYDRRLSNHVVNRLNWPGDGDILIPQRRMMVIGTTSFEVEDVDYIPVVDEQVQQMRASAIELVPEIAHTAQRGIYMSARPLVGAGDGRSLARTFKCFDHKESDGVEGLVTITGGKATTCRAMAEKTADLVCAKLGVKAQCQTSQLPLASYREFFRE